LSDLKERMNRVLVDLGFGATHDTRGRASITDLIPAVERCGIYVLHFADGQHYVGQSVEVTARFVAHRRNYPDIDQVSFKPVPRALLDAEERRAVHQFEQAGLALRNIEFVSWPIGVSSFDQVMPAEDQERWLADLTWIDTRGPRGADPALRHRTAHKLAQLRKRPEYEQAIGLTRAYVRTAIPAAWRGEMQFWSVSCLPSPAVYMRVNVYQQEVFRVDREGDELYCALFLSRLPRLERFRLRRARLLRSRGVVEIIEGGYAPGGQNQMSLYIHGASNALKLLRNEAVLAAARRFSLSLMKKGPNLNRESHCIDLADFLLEGASA
jgi:hypothetical protein